MSCCTSFGMTLEFALSPRRSFRRSLGQRVPYTKEQSRSAGLNSNPCRQRWRSAMHWMRPSPNSDCGWKMISPRVLPENLRGQCCVALRELDETRQGRILDAAARVRFQAKGGTISRPRPARRLGAGAVGRLVPRARLQTQRLADAKSCRIAPALDARRGPGLCAASAAARPQRFAAGGIDPRRRRAAMVICVASGIAGGGNAMSSAIAFCRAPSGNFTDCVRPIIRNAGWRWPRTGWRREIWFQNSNAGARWIFCQAVAADVSPL